MKKSLVFGILALLAFMIVLAGCATVGKAYIIENSTTIDGDLVVKGKVGIGANPTTPLQISASGKSNYAILTLQDADSSGADVVAGTSFMDGSGKITGYMADSNAGDSEIYLTNNLGGLVFSDNSGEVIRIRNGNVGIGATSPNFKLDVAGDVNLRTKDFYRFNAENTGLTSPSASTLQFQTSGEPRLHITSTGNVGIGTAKPETKLHVEGDAPSIRIEDAGWQSWDIRSARGNLVFLRGEGTVTVMTLTEAGKLQTKSPDGNLWCCGPANGGSWSCANTTKC